jgi:hypothetical protein
VIASLGGYPAVFVVASVAALATAALALLRESPRPADLREVPAVPPA